MSVQSDALRLAPTPPSVKDLVRDDTGEAGSAAGLRGTCPPCRPLGHSR